MTADVIRRMCLLSVSGMDVGKSTKKLRVYSKAVKPGIPSSSSSSCVHASPVPWIRMYVAVVSIPKQQMTRRDTAEHDGMVMATSASQSANMRLAATSFYIALIFSSDFLSKLRTHYDTGEIRTGG